MIQPLRSTSITEASTLLRVGPPLCSASVLSLSWVLHFEFLPYHRNDRFPRSTQEPDSGSRHLYAGCHPSSKQVPLGLILVSRKLPVLTSSDFISTPHRWFACARLPEPYLTQSSAGPFPTTLTTKALDLCSLRWFETYSCKSVPRGLPSSLVQPRGARRVARGSFTPRPSQIRT